MARPAKAIAAKTGAITKEEEKIRLETESALRGSEPPKPSRHLTKNQKKIFKEITNELIDANVLANLTAIFWMKQLGPLTASGACRKLRRKNRTSLWIRITSGQTRHT